MAGSSGSLLAHDLTPAPGPVVRDDGPKHGDERLIVDRLPPTDGHGPSRLVFVPRGDDARRIGDEGVVEKHVHVVLRRQERADVAPQDEVRTIGALDGLRNLGIGGVHQSAYPAADTLLPVGERLDVNVDAGIVGRVCHGRSRIPSSQDRHGHPDGSAKRRCRTQPYWASRTDTALSHQPRTSALTAIELQSSGPYHPTLSLL